MFVFRCLKIDVEVTGYLYLLPVFVLPVLWNTHVMVYSKVLLFLPYHSRPPGVVLATCYSVMSVIMHYN